MAYNKKGSIYYGTVTDANYVLEKEEVELGRIVVNGTLKEKNTCTAKVNVSISGTMQEELEKHIGEEDIELTIENEEYTKTIDLSDLKNNNPVPLEFILQDNTPKIIKAYLTLTNQDKEQNYLANSNLSINIIIDDFKCTTDTEAPIITNFYIKEDTEENYTNQIPNTAHITWDDKDVKEYCITDTEGSSNCEGKWKTASGNEVTESITLSSEEGEQTYYAYLKDQANNISTGDRYDTIIYDITAPTISNAIAESITQTGFTINITANDTKDNIRTSGIDKYCYGTTDSPNEQSYTCVDNSQISISDLQAGQSYTYYIYAKDKAGNSGITNKRQFTFKTADKIAGDYVKDKTDSQYLKPAYDGDELTRYIGTKDEITNNYICFGTTDIEQCTKTNPDAYMYRIIGIQNKDNNTLGLNTNQLKIIKAIPVKENGEVKKLVWNSNDTNSSCGSSSAENGNCYWDATGTETTGAIAQWYLNNTFLNTITGATEGKNWKELISEPKWYKGDLVDSTGTSFKTTQEVAIPTSAGFKVGLMYATDYYNAGVQNTANWLFIQNGWNGNKVENEWTMTRYGYNSGHYSALLVYFSYGYLYYNFLIISLAVRPVFYLIPEITLTGEGTEDNPFIIHPA